MSGGIITHPKPEAVEAGADVLREGGNAIDAAVACALVQTAGDPLMYGPAGFGTMHIHMPGRGAPLKVGERLRNPDMAHTLRRITEALQHAHGDEVPPHARPAPGQAALDQSAGAGDRRDQAPHRGRRHLP